MYHYLWELLVTPQALLVAAIGNVFNSLIEHCEVVVRTHLEVPSSTFCSKTSYSYWKLPWFTSVTASKHGAGAVWAQI